MNKNVYKNKEIMNNIWVELSCKIITKLNAIYTNNEASRYPLNAKRRKKKKKKCMDALSIHVYIFNHNIQGISMYANYTVV